MGPLGEVHHATGQHLLDVVIWVIRRNCPSDVPCPHVLDVVYKAKIAEGEECQLGNSGIEGEDVYAAAFTVWYLSGESSLRMKNVICG